MLRYYNKVALVDTELTKGVHYFSTVTLAVTLILHVTDDVALSISCAVVASTCHHKMHTLLYLSFSAHMICGKRKTLFFSVSNFCIPKALPDNIELMEE